MPSQEHETIIELLKARPRPESPTVEETCAPTQEVISEIVL